MQLDRVRFVLGAGLAVLALGLAACGGSEAPVAPTQAQAPGAAASASQGRTVTASLSTSSTSYAIPLSGGYRASLTLHASGVPAGTKILLGVQQPQLATVSRLHNFSRTHSCPATLTIPLINPFRFPIVLNVDGFSLSLPCSVDGTLFGVSFYQLEPAPPIASSLKVGDITAIGNSITFTSDVATITLPPRTETALSIIPEGSTAEVGIPFSSGGGTAMLTSNTAALPGLTVAYNSGGGGGSLFSSGCAPAYTGTPPVLAAPLVGVPILGIPQFYCLLGTVDSATVGFGTTNVTFTIASPLPDLSFIGLDGPAGEYLCSPAPSGPITCSTSQFAVPTIQNVIVGNVQDLQICLPASAEQNCNTTGNSATPAPSTTGATVGNEVDVLVADDPTYVSVPPGTCTSPAICGGFYLATSGSTCVIDNGPDENGDAPPGYTDPGGPQESPKVSSGTSSSAFFPAVGPFTEFDIIPIAAGPCTITVTEHDGPAQPAPRSATLTLNVTGSSRDARPRARVSQAH